MENQTLFSKFIKKKDLIKCLGFLGIFVIIFTSLFTNIGFFNPINTEMYHINDELSINDVNRGGYIMDMGIEYSWIEINETGTSIMYYLTEISFSEGGWNFTFYESEYDTINLFYFGCFSFTIDDYTPLIKIPSVSKQNEDCMALLNPLSRINMRGGYVLYEFLTEPNRLIIEYFNISRIDFLPTEELYFMGSFELILFENGDIIFQYKDVNISDLNPIIGIDHGDLTNFNSYEPSTDLLIEKAIKFTPTRMMEIEYDLGVEIGQKFSWITTSIDKMKMKHYFGTGWENLFGFTLPSKYQKIQLEITSLLKNTTNIGFEYNLWNWINKDDHFSAKNDVMGNIMYPLNPDKIILSQIIPFILPTPSPVYIYRANLDYNYSLTYDPDSDTSTLRYKLDPIIPLKYVCYNIYAYGVYDSDGILKKVTVLYNHHHEYFTEVLFSIYRYYESPKPTYVSINEGEVYEYEIFSNPVSIEENVNNSDLVIKGIPDGYVYGILPYIRMKIRVELMIIENPKNEKVLVVLNQSFLYKNGTWMNNPQLIYIHSIFKSYESIGNIISYPFFINNNINWSDYVLKIREEDKWDYISSYNALERGFTVEYDLENILFFFPYDLFFTPGGIVEYIYTEDGVLNVANQYINDILCLSYRLISFNRETSDYNIDINIAEILIILLLIFISASGLIWKIKKRK